MPLTANEASASLVPIDERAESRLQIPDPKREKFAVFGEKKSGKQKKGGKSAERFLCLLRIL